MVRLANFADGFTSASEPVVVGGSQENYSLNNNQATTDIVGLIFSNTNAKSIFMEFELERIGSVEYRQTGTMTAYYNGTWSITFGNFTGNDLINDSISNPQEVILTINSATGQVRYLTGNQAGHVSSKIKIISTRIFV